MERAQTIFSAYLAEGLREVRAHPSTFAGGLLALIVLTYLVTSSAGLDWQLRQEAQTNLGYGLLGGLAGFAATSLGALTALGLRGISARTEDTLLGFAAGMMLAAASFSLIIPGIAAGEEILSSGPAAAGLVALGLGLGVLLMLALDRFIPHAHCHVGDCGPAHDRLSRVWLFVLAIAIHNLPEGMAIGVSFSAGDLSVGLPLASAIAIQDIPEGMAVALSLRAVGVSMGRSVLVAAASGLLEPLGAVLGWAMTGGFDLAYPLGMGIAAGAMIFVVSHEVIPETHRRGHQTWATHGLMVGFAVMMFLDNALG